MKRCQKCNVPLEGTISKLLKTVLRVRPSSENPSLCNHCQTKTKPKTYTCQICNRSVDESDALTHVKAEEYLLHLIKKDHPEWNKEKETCPQCVDYYRDLIKKAKI
jgi:hypothetical protein